MRASLFLALLILSACAGDALEKLRRAEPTGSAFHQALANYYLAFADQEAARYDWVSSQHFAAKGLAASYGSDVQPEQMEYWTLDIRDRNTREALAQARAWLMAHRDAPSDSVADQVAKAQVYFDCWIEESTELGQSKAGAHCREELEGLLLALGPVQHGAGKVRLKDPMKAPEVTLTYLVFFDLGSTELNRDAMEVLDIILTDLHNVDDYEIVLNGHSDASGSQEANMELSLKRAKRVESALLAAGVPPELISLYAFGETDPREGAERVPRKANRRVEVVIN